MTLLEAHEDYCTRAKEKACCDYGFHVILDEMNDQVEEDMAELVKRGVNSFKMFMAYKVQTRYNANCSQVHIRISTSIRQKKQI